MDPWLDGPQSDVASWFSKQSQLVEISVRTIARLNDIVQDAEGSTLDMKNGAKGDGCSFSSMP